jgi:hypothetical protein
MAASRVCHQHSLCVCNTVTAALAPSMVGAQWRLGCADQQQPCGLLA